MIRRGKERRTGWFGGRRWRCAAFLLLSGGLVAGSFAQPAQAQQLAALTGEQAAAASAQVAARPALWVVRSGDATIFLFGTFHFLGRGHDWLSGPVRAAFDGADELVLEARVPEDVARMQQVIFRLGVDPHQRRLSMRLTRDEWARVRQAIGPQLADAMNEAALEPWVFSLSITNHTGQRLGLTPELGADRVLRAEAGRRNMDLVALETVDFQLRIYDRVGLTEQLRGVREALEDSAAPETSMLPLLNAWARGDTDRVAAHLARKIDDPEMRRTLLTSRNASWARWIATRLRRPGNVFFAVGIGHLVGADSVQDHLARLGVQVTRVQ